jgi:2-aminoadipate transaminase
MSTAWEDRYAQRTSRMGGSAIREILKLTEQPDIISFAGGLPAPEFFPGEDVIEACIATVRDNGAHAMQYSQTEGLYPLREWLAGQMAGLDKKINAENVMITSGSQQALDMIGRTFIDAGDRIVAESPTYLGALQAWNIYGAEYLAVPSDHDGIITDGIEKVLEQDPKFMYLLPNFQNPSGVSISMERRKKLVALAAEYGVPIVEDDPYGALRFEGEELPSVIALDSQRDPASRSYNGSVIYLSTFSKILVPGFRLAWVVAPKAIIDKLAMGKQAMDLHTATFTQYVTNEICRSGFLEGHIQRLRQEYRQRRDLMLEMLEQHMPEGVRWTHPTGGLFLWVVVPQGMDTVEIFKEAVKEKVAFVPGEGFHPQGGVNNTMRLNFSNARPEQIRSGIARLGKVLKRLMN